MTTTRKKTKKTEVKVAKPKTARKPRKKVVKAEPEERFERIGDEEVKMVSTLILIIVFCLLVLSIYNRCSSPTEATGKAYEPVPGQIDTTLRSASIEAVE